MALHPFAKMVLDQLTRGRDGALAFKPRARQRLVRAATSAANLLEANQELLRLSSFFANVRKQPRISQALFDLAGQLAGCLKKKESAPRPFTGAGSDSSSFDAKQAGTPDLKNNP